MDYFIAWHQSRIRKPLIIRGARQIGKSYLVRLFSRQQKLTLIEINFEKNTTVIALFKTWTAAQIVSWIEAEYKINLKEKNHLVFFDEIQLIPHLIKELRYFKEDFGHIAVVAAGSLLEFAFSDAEFSVPVGRIEFLHMYPMTFEEFLIATEEKKLLEAYASFSGKKPIDPALHPIFQKKFKIYSFLGGMPEVLSLYCQQHQDLLETSKALSSINQTFEQDFHKYRRKIAFEIMLKVFHRIPLMVGKKIKYNEIDRDQRSLIVYQAITLLNQAKVVHKISAVSGNGLPLRAEVKDKYFKAIYLDVGLYQSILGLRWHEIENIQDLNLINQGALSEQIVGQELLASGEHYAPSELYYWFREAVSSNAELDYLISVGENILPIEVKSGARGKLKSLNLYCQEKKPKVAIRLYAENFKIHKRAFAETTLLDIPLYLAGKIRSLKL